ncbi:MAG: C40 family peptidase [Muribaculaceae bacterium]|nr:C40 family peptidase [Muribaculaceae bacterium]
MFRKLIISGIVSIAAASSVAETPDPYLNGEASTILIKPNFVNTAGMEIFDEPEEADDNLELVAEILLEADRHLGTRYMRGGKTPRGFDCSGFTSYVFKQFGYKLGASSGDQYKQGTAVESTDVKPGDLLFFKGRSRNSVGHVAIAIDTDPDTGDIIFIHSATSGGIRVDRVSSPYYNKRYLGARRVLN